MEATGCFSLIAKKISGNSTETGKTVDCPHFQRLVVLAEQEMQVNIVFTDPR